MLGAASGSMSSSRSRNDLFWPGYKTGAGIDPDLLSQFPLLEDALDRRRHHRAGRWSNSRPTMHWRPPAAIADRDARVEKKRSSARRTRISHSPGARHAREAAGTRRTRELRDEGWRDRCSASHLPIPDHPALVGDAPDGYPTVRLGRQVRRRAAVRPPEDIPGDPRECVRQCLGGAALARTINEREHAFLFRITTRSARTSRRSTTCRRIRWRWSDVGVLLLRALRQQR